MSALAPTDPIAQAWAHAQQAGLGRPFVQPVPSPALQAVDQPLAWRLAHVLAEATALQQAVGDWVSAPQAKARELQEALAGLRKGPRGPRWWRRLSHHVHVVTLSNWRTTLETFRGQALVRHRQTRALMGALDQMKAALQRALEGAYPPQAQEWAFQAQLLLQTLQTVENRVLLRERLEAESLDLCGRGLAAVALLQNTQGLNDEQAWELARRRLEGEG